MRLALSCVPMLVYMAVLLPAGELLPPPSDDAQKEAEKLIRDLFKADLAKQSLFEKAATASKLLQQGVDTKDDPAAAFVLLRMASDYGAQGADIEIALKAVESMAARYELKVMTLKEKAIEQTAKFATTKDPARKVAEKALALSEDAVLSDDYEVAIRMASRAESMAKTAQDVPLYTRAQAKGKDYRTLQTAYAKLKEAQAKLATNPDDPQANHAVGKFFLIAKKDADQAIPMLVKSSDAKWAEAAKLDQAQPKDGAEQVAVADKWWELASGAPKVEADSIKTRAIHWYNKALPSLTGLSRTKIEKQITEVESAGGGVNLIQLIDPSVDILRGGGGGSGGTWTCDGRTLTCTNKGDPSFIQIPYLPPPEYDLNIIANDSFAISLPIDGHSLRALFETGAGFDMLRNGQRGGHGSTGKKDKLFADGQFHAINIRVRKGAILATCDGATVLEWKGIAREYSHYYLYRQPNPMVFAVSWGKSFKKIQMIPVGGQGRPLRDQQTATAPQPDPTAAQAETFLIGKSWRYAWGSSSRIVKFGPAGAITEGGGESESTYRVRQGKLEFVTRNGSLFARFTYQTEKQRWVYERKSNPDCQSQRYDLTLELEKQ